MSRPIGTADELERRRRRAVQAVAGGQPRKTVAKVLGVHPKTVARWVRASRRPGGLAAKPQPGPTPGLSDAQLRRLEALLAKGAKAHGWPNELWTAARVARLIERRFRRRAYLVFLDESGFFLTPTVRRTLAPRGRTPVLEAWDRRDRWSAISGVTLSPRSGRPGLYFELLPHNARGGDVVAFLAGLYRRLGPFTVVWDRNQIHAKSKAVRAWLAGHPRVTAEDFPGYVPDLNPDEGVWGWAKYGRLANLAAEDADELWGWVTDELVEVKHRPDLLKAFIRQTKLPGLVNAA